jgi:hypothetical protein
MTSEARARWRKMTKEERAAMRRAEKETADEVLSWKLALSSKLNAMTTEERLAYYMEIGDKYRSRGLNIVSRHGSI